MNLSVTGTFFLNRDNSVSYMEHPLQSSTIKLVSDLHVMKLCELIQANKKKSVLLG